MPGIYDFDYIAERWIVDTLSVCQPLIGIIGENTELNMPQIYRGLAPETGIPVDPSTGYTRPFVIYALQSGGSANNLTISSHIVWGDGLYLVKVVGLAAQGDLVSRANRAIKEALHRGSGGTVEGNVLTCVQEHTVVLPIEVVDGVAYEHRGGVYRVLGQEL